MLKGSCRKALPFLFSDKDPFIRCSMLDVRCSSFKPLNPSTLKPSFSTIMFPDERLRVTKKSLHFCFHCSRDFFAQRGQRPALGFDISFIIVDPGGLEEAGYFADQLLFAVATGDNPT